MTSLINTRLDLMLKCPQKACKFHISSMYMGVLCNRADAFDTNANLSLLGCKLLSQPHAFVTNSCTPSQLFLAN